MSLAANLYRSGWLRPFLHARGGHQLGLLLSLKNMQGLTVSAVTLIASASMLPGPRIGIIGRALKQIGLFALANQGDIDTRAIAGPFDRWHRKSGLASVVPPGPIRRPAPLVQPDGSVFDVDSDRDTETMGTAQDFSIVMLGVISTIALQAVST